MSSFKPFRSIIAKSVTPSLLRRSFHTSKSLHARRKPKYPSIKASELGVKDGKVQFPKYSAAEKAALHKQYTPAQIAAIEAGEAAVDPNDLSAQATLREDSMALPYLDDLSEIHPVVDKPIRAPESNHDPNLRLKKVDEFLGDVAHWLQDQTNDPEKVDWVKFTDNVRLTVGKEEAERNPPSSLAPEIPIIDALVPSKDRKRLEESEHVGEITDQMLNLMLQTGLSARKIGDFYFKTLVFRRVNKMTSMGRNPKMYFLTVAGNKNGLLGVGEAKASDSLNARHQSQLNAIRNLKPIARYENRTIYGDLGARVGGTDVQLMTRPPGKLFPRLISFS